jgi:hypothetical protein
VNANSQERASLVPAALLPQNTDNAVEIEISPRWPLARADAPRGLTASSATAKNGLIVTNLGSSPSTGTPTGNVDQNKYVDDYFRLEGSFDLSRAPYALHPKQIANPPSQVTNSNTAKNSGTTMGTTVIQDLLAVKFDNVFVDWGDGTIEPIEALVAPSGDVADHLLPAEYVYQVSCHSHIDPDSGDAAQVSQQ